MAAREGRQLTSTVRSGGTLELAIERVPVPEPGSQEVLIRVEAAPINPSDLGMLFAMADLATVRTAGSPDRPAVQADVPPALMRAAAARVDQSLPAGNEGAGIVIAAGDSDEAQALIGRTVAVLGGAMYAEYRIAKAKQCLVLADGTPPRAAASCFVNPLTALGMVETMRLEGHTALAHTAAASNLGQMLQKICLKDGIQLVNVVRSPKQVELLKDIGARWVVDSSSDTFSEDLTDALAATGATIAFDATGPLLGDLLRPRPRDPGRPARLAGRGRRSLCRDLEPRLHAVREPRGRLARAAAAPVDRHRHGARARRRGAAGQARQLRHRPDAGAD
jgi:NADPH:quinone reductase-like Zn-dependent oxidoreductase